MQNKCTVPSPFIFNCWKHQLNFLKELHTIPIEKIKENILKIGESQMDLYTGDLTTNDICEEIKGHLKKLIKINLLNYLQWLQAEGKSFKLLQISDGSQWTLRFGEDPVNYIHIHPGRHSPHTVRVKSYALKTALIIASLNIIEEQINTGLINTIRKEYLNLAPLKSVKEDAAVIKLVGMLK